MRYGQPDRSSDTPRADELRAALEVALGAGPGVLPLAEADRRVRARALVQVEGEAGRDVEDLGVLAGADEELVVAERGGGGVAEGGLSDVLVVAGAVEGPRAVRGGHGEPAAETGAQAVGVAEPAVAAARHLGQAHDLDVGQHRGVRDRPVRVAPGAQLQPHPAPPGHRGDLKEQRVAAVDHGVGGGAQPELGAQLVQPPQVVQLRLHQRLVGQPAPVRGGGGRRQEAVVPQPGLRLLEQLVGACHAERRGGLSYGLQVPQLMGQRPEFVLGRGVSPSVLGAEHPQVESVGPGAGRVGADGAVGPDQGEGVGDVGLGQQMAAVGADRVHGAREGAGAERVLRRETRGALAVETAADAVGAVGVSGPQVAGEVRADAAGEVESAVERGVLVVLDRVDEVALQVDLLVDALGDRGGRRDMRVQPHDADGPAVRVGEHRRVQPAVALHRQGAAQHRFAQEIGELGRRRGVQVGVEVLGGTFVEAARVEHRVHAVDRQVVQVSGLGQFLMGIGVGVHDVLREPDGDGSVRLGKPPVVRGIGGGGDNCRVPYVRWVRATRVRRVRDRGRSGVRVQPDLPVAGEVVGAGRLVAALGAGGLHDLGDGGRAVRLVVGEGPGQCEVDPADRARRADRHRTGPRQRERRERAGRLRRHDLPGAVPAPLDMLVGVARVEPAARGRPRVVERQPYVDLPLDAVDVERDPVTAEAAQIRHVQRHLLRRQHVLQLRAHGVVRAGRGPAERGEDLPVQPVDDVRRERLDMHQAPLTVVPPPIATEVGGTTATTGRCLDRRDVALRGGHGDDGRNARHDRGGGLRLGLRVRVRRIGVRVTVSWDTVRGVDVVTTGVGGVSAGSTVGVDVGVDVGVVRGSGRVRAGRAPERPSGTVAPPGHRRGVDDPADHVEVVGPQPAHHVRRVVRAGLGHGPGGVAHQARGAAAVRGGGVAAALVAQAQLVADLVDELVLGDVGKPRVVGGRDSVRRVGEGDVEMRGLAGGGRYDVDPQQASVPQPVTRRVEDPLDPVRHPLVHTVDLRPELRTSVSR